MTFDISERKRFETTFQRASKKVALLNTVIFNDIQNTIFVQRGYQEILKPVATDPCLAIYLEKEKAAVTEIQASLEFARQYNEMGINPPRWQNVAEVMVFAVSHRDLGNMRLKFQLQGLAIYADALLERVFFNLVKNAIQHAGNVTVIRAGYIVTANGSIIFVEEDDAGLPAGAKEWIFDKGTGMGGSVGLFLSREILSLTGITIRETSVAGKGARFEMTVHDGSYRIYTKE